MKQPKRLSGQSPAHNNAANQERRAAKRIGGRTTPGSGSGYQKGDARRRGLVRVECKCTGNSKGYRVTHGELAKLQRGAFGSDEIPVMEIELMGDGPNERAYVVPAWAMDDLLERLCRGVAD